MPQHLLHSENIIRAMYKRCAIDFHMECIARGRAAWLSQTPFSKRCERSPGHPFLALSIASWKKRMTC